MFICCDDPVLRDIVSSIAALVQKVGGVVHPRICFTAEKSSLSVHCMDHEKTDDFPLLHLPHDALIPIDHLAFETRDEEIHLLSPATELSGVRLSLLKLMLDLYNCTKKLSWQRTHNARFALAAYPTIREALQLVRPSSASPLPAPADAFLQTRIFGFSENSPGLANASVLLPLIDMINHHPLGAKFEICHRGLGVGVRTPNGDTECFVRYRSRLDALDLALGYGYSDRHTPFARSAPVSVALDSVGRITVMGKFVQPSHPLDPPALKFAGDEMFLSHLVCDRRNPGKFHFAIRLVINALCERRGLTDAQTKVAHGRIVDALCNANLNQLGQLQRAVAPVVDRVPAAAILHEAAAVQADNLRAVMLGCETRNSELGA